MAILLTILKIIGIILLVILGLILLILLIVLFSPISYRLKAEHNEKTTNADVRVGFLIVKAVGSFIKGEGLDYYVKVLFFKIMSKDKKKPKEDYFAVDLPDEEELAAVDSLNDNSPDNNSLTDNPADNASTANASDTNTVSDTENASNVSGTNYDQTVNSTFDSSENNSSENDSAENVADKPKEKVPIKERINSIPDKIDETIDKIDETIDGLDKKYVEAMKKLDHVDQFLDRPYVQKTIKRSFKIIRRLFGTIKPKKSKGYLHMGLGSAGDTGMILGKLAAFYPLYGRWLTIEPDFYYKVIEGDIDIKGRIYLFRFIGPALGMVLTPSFWKTVKLAKKI